MSQFGNRYGNLVWMLRIFRIQSKYLKKVHSFDLADKYICSIFSHLYSAARDWTERVKARACSV